GARAHRGPRTFREGGAPAMTGSTRARSGGRPPRVEWWNPFARYERMREPLLPWSKFFGRLARGVLVAATLILGSLAVGVLGYHGSAAATRTREYAGR